MPSLSPPQVPHYDSHYDSPARTCRGNVLLGSVDRAASSYHHQGAARPTLGLFLITDVILISAYLNKSGGQHKYEFTAGMSRPA